MKSWKVNALIASQNCAAEAFRRRGQFYAWMRLSNMWAAVYADKLDRAIAVYHERHLRARFLDRFPAIACELVVAGGVITYLVTPSIATGAGMLVTVLTTVALANCMPLGRELLPPTLYVPPWATRAMGCWWFSIVVWALLGGPMWFTGVLVCLRSAWAIWIVVRACVEEYKSP